MPALVRGLASRGVPGGSCWAWSTYGRMIDSYAAKALTWSLRVASSPASTYAPASARLVPIPLIGDAQ